MTATLRSLMEEAAPHLPPTRVEDVAHRVVRHRQRQGVVGAAVSLALVAGAVSFWPTGELNTVPVPIPPATASRTATPSVAATLSSQPSSSAPSTGTEGAGTGQVTKTIPVALRGTWNANRQRCSVTGPTEQKLVITGTTLKFYEAHGEVTSVTTTGRTYAVYFTATGEGVTEKSARIFTLSPDGKTATFTIPDRAGSGGTIYRCP